jgi:hypothetical protein
MTQPKGEGVARSKAALLVLLLSTTTCMLACWHAAECSCQGISFCMIHAAAVVFLAIDGSLLVSSVAIIIL